MTGRAQHFRQADDFDAAGNHTAAIGVLARAANGGDIAAMTQLGNRLLTGDRAPWLPRDGAQLLIRSMQAGDGEAAARLAVLVATGSHVHQSWPDALDLLARAAEQNWAPAQSQLRLLGGARGGVVSHGSQREEWLRLAASVDLRFWLTAPTSSVLSSEALVRTFDALLPVAVCDWLITTARPRLERARVYDASGGQHRVHDVRSNSAASFNLNEVEIVHLLVQARMAAACGLPATHMEAASILHYRTGERFDAHYDYIDPASEPQTSELARAGQRAVTFLAYLNDDFEGGETHFPRLGVAHRPRRGAGLAFVNVLADDQPNPRTLHAGLAPAGGEKWVFSQFVRSRPFIGAGHA